jgi:ABC-type Mn2+/Zn2+ transport system ATPase subunit
VILAHDAATGYDGVPVLRDLTFEIAAGQRVALLGPNGGGKTTLFRALLGELPLMAGTLAVEARCATVPQTERARLDYPVSALDVALMGTLSRLPWWRRPGRAERERAAAALSSVDIGCHASCSFGELSGGQRQRVLIARALMQDARILLLDEPFSGLDAPSAERLTELIDRLAGEGRAVLIATHDVDQALAWDKVLCLNRRQVAFGSPGETLTPRVLEQTYGGDLVELPAGGGLRAVLPPHHHEHDDADAARHEHGHEHPEHHHPVEVRPS